MRERARKFARYNSSELARLFRGDGARRRPGPKARPEHFHIAHPQFSQFISVEADAFEVGESDLSPGLESSHDFTNSFAAAFVARDIVNREVGDGGVEAAVDERQFAHVAVANFDATGDAFEFGVAKSGFAGIAGLILLRPEIDADSAPAGKLFRGGNQQ